jgi:streptogramin lyase
MDARSGCTVVHLERSSTVRPRLFARALGVIIVVGVAAVVAFAVAAVASTGAHSLKIVRTYQRYAGEEGLAVGFGSVWTGGADSFDSVARTDIATGTSRSIHAPIDEDTGLYTGLDAVWQTDFGHGIVRRIDPATNHVTARGGFAGPDGIAFAGREVFVALHHGQAVVQIDPTTLKIVHTYRLPAAAEGAVASGPSDVAVTPGSLWVDVGNLGATYRLALVGGGIRARLPGCTGPFATTAGTLWASCRGHLARVDLRTNAVHITTAPAGIPVALEAAIWVAGTSTIDNIDPTTGAVESQQRFKGSVLQDLVAAQGNLWAFDANRVQVLELQPSSSR